MKKITIHFWANNNLGDDLLVANFINNTNFDAYKILISWPYFHPKTIQTKKAIKSLLKKPVKFITDSSKYVKLPHKDEHFIYIGGSMWPEKWLDNKFRFFRNVSKNFASFNIFNTNFSNYESDKSIVKINSLLEMTNSIIVRDSYSRKLINLKEFNFDSVYSLKTNIPKKKRDQLIVSFTFSDEGFNNGDQNDFKNNKIILICDEIEKRKRDFKIINLISFHDYKDVPVLSALKKELKSRNIKSKIIKYKGKPKKIIKIIGFSKYSIATRFHSIVLSILHKTEVFPISYDNKNLNHLKDINFSNEKWNKLNEKEMKKIIDSSNQAFENITFSINQK